MAERDLTAERLHARMQELESGGKDPSHAFGIASLEERIRQWPQGWGDNFHFFIYGDFRSPEDKIEYPLLGITILPENRKDKIGLEGLTVLECITIVESKSIPALIDACRRINVLLGVYTLHQWGNGAVGWWSWITHRSGGGLLTKLTDDGAQTSVENILKLPTHVRRRVEAALLWIREPHRSVLQSHRSDVLRTYSAYWNAFECLVEAVNLVKPRASLSRSEKQVRLDEFIQERNGELTAEDVELAYRRIVNQGFREKAMHALRICFNEHGDYYGMECFGLADRRNRLYDVRNAINHGDIDAENPEELARVEGRLARLWMIIWRIFGCFVSFPVPADSAHTSR